jgi:NAD-dependent deacetylase
METRIQDFCLVTQNVDGLHQRAGSRNVLELHGNIHRSRCFREDVLVNLAEAKGDIPPQCPGCGSYLRPDVVWFGESLSEDTLRQAWEAVNQCDLFFSIGTSALVHPAAGLPEIALRSGAEVVEININRTPLTQKATYFLQGSAVRVLPLVLRSSWPE